MKKRKIYEILKRMKYIKIISYKCQKMHEHVRAYDKICESVSNA